MSEMYELLSAVPTSNNVIPESCLSFSEQALFIAEFASNEYNNMIQELGIKELLEYEINESMVIYEGEKAKALKETIKKFIAKVFGAIKKLFTNIKKYFDGLKSSKNKKLVDKLTAESIDCIPDGKVIATTHQFYDFKKVNFASKALKFGKEIDKTYKALAGSSKDDIKKATYLLNEKLIKSVSGVDAKDIKSMRAKVKEEMLGNEISVDKKWLKSSLHLIKDVLVGDVISSSIKTAYNDQKKSMDAMYSLVATYDDIKFLDIVPIWCGTIADAINTADICYAIAFDTYKKMYREFLNIVVKANKYSCKKEEKKTVKESTYTDQYNMINSVFDF